MSNNYSDFLIHDDFSVLKEIRYALAYGLGKGMWKLESMRPIEAYYLHLDGEYGVAVVNEGCIPVDESFSDVRYAIRDFRLVESGEAKRCLSLTCLSHHSQYGDKFEIFCYDFLMWIKNADNALENPFLWWMDWKEMVGNADREKRTYPVIAEMIVLDIMQKRGLNPIWEGPKSGTVDIRSDTYDCEVKSTSSRYELGITITSLNQLNRNGRDLHLIYVIFEQSESGLSIDDMVKRLSSNGIDITDIEENLDLLGLSKGNYARTIRYSPLRILEMIVNDDFPCISYDSFKNNCLPQGIKKISYVVDVSTVDSESLSYPLK